MLAGSGTTAHAAIVARSLGIPLVTGAGADVLAVTTGAEVGVDADRGMVWLSPDAETRARLRERTERLAEQADRDRRERRQPARTADGRTVRLLANAGTAAEVDRRARGRRRGHRPPAQRALVPRSLRLAQRGRARAGAAHRCSSRSETGSRRCARSTSAATRRPRSWSRREPGTRSGPAASGSRLQAEDGVAPQLRALFRVCGDAVVRVLVPMVTDAGEIDAVRAIAVAARDAVAPGRPTRWWAR